MASLITILRLQQQLPSVANERQKMGKNAIQNATQKQ